MGRTRDNRRGKIDRAKIREIMDEECKAREERKEIATRQANGKGFCNNKLRGYDDDSKACKACKDREDCRYETSNRLFFILDDLSRRFPDYLYRDEYDYPEGCDTSSRKQEIIDFAERIMKIAYEDQTIQERIKNIKDKTHKTLDVIVEGWKVFRKKIVSNKPQLNPVEVLNELAAIWDKASDAACEVTGIEDSRKAWEMVQEPYYFSQRKDIVETLRSDIRTFTEKLTNTFPAEFNRDKDIWPTEWMKKDKKIRTMMARWEVFSPLLNAICRMSLGFSDSKRLAQELRLDKYSYDGMEYDLILLPEGLDYTTLGKQLGKSSALVKKYLQRLATINVVKLHRKRGPRGYTVFSLGFWRTHHVENGPGVVRRWYLVNNPQFRKALGEFTPYAKTENLE